MPNPQDNAVPTRLLTRNETTRLRLLIANHGEHHAAALVGVNHLTQTRALSGLPMEASTVARIRSRLAELPKAEVAQ